MCKRRKQETGYNESFAAWRPFFEGPVDFELFLARIGDVRQCRPKGRRLFVHTEGGGKKVGGVAVGAGGGVGAVGVDKIAL